MSGSYAPPQVGNLRLVFAERLDAVVVHAYELDESRAAPEFLAEEVDQVRFGSRRGPDLGLPAEF